MTEKEHKAAHAMSQARERVNALESAFKMGQRPDKGPTFTFVPGETFGQLRAIAV